MRYLFILFCCALLNAAEQYDKVLTNLPEDDIRGAQIGHQIQGGDTYYVFIHKDKGKTYGVGEYQAKGGKPVRLERVALTPDQINRIDRYFLWMTQNSVFTGSSRPLPPQWFFASCGEFPWRKAWVTRQPKAILPDNCHPKALYLELMTSRNSVN